MLDGCARRSVLATLCRLPSAVGTSPPHQLLGSFCLDSVTFPAASFRMPAAFPASFSPSSKLSYHTDAPWVILSNDISIYQNPIFRPTGKDHITKVKQNG